MRIALFGLLIMLLTNISHAFDQSHKGLTAVMKKFNTGGLINYKGLKADPSLLTSYTKSLKEITTDDFQKWPEKDKVSFWINAYNAFTLKAIIDNYPIKSSFFKSVIYPKNSIRQISGVWDKLKFPVLDKDLTLEQIEHEILRKEFNEPRIHMALVCAALSCPPLREEAFTGEKFEAQMKDQARRFFATPTNFKIDSSEDAVYVSQIFNWFGEDFNKNYGTTDKFANHNEKERSVLNYLSQFLSEADQRYLDSAKYEVEYLKYDWTLNERQ